MPGLHTTFDPSPRRMLDPAGELVAEAPKPSLSDGEMVELLRAMVRTRAFDERCLRLQRTGRIPAYYPCAGQEAMVAVPAALAERDWVFTAYREQGVRLARGVPVAQELAVWRGMPFAAWNPREFRITPINATIGTHLPHATGYAYAVRLLERDEVALAIFGDGATSESDFHSGLNFAGVWKTPTVFFCQNNYYAQSTPLAEQTASETLAQKAIAYGFEGVVVDGMDVLAVHEVVREAVEKARSGGGPTLIESLCYRYTAHSTYDGTPIYRTRDEEAEWRERDPIARMEKHLAARGLVDGDFVQKIEAEMKAEVEAAIDELEAMPLPTRDAMYRSTYHRIPERVVAQLHAAQDAAGEPRAEIPAEARLVPGAEPEAGGEQREMTLVEALNTALAREMEHRKETVILGEDVAREGGVFRVTAGLYDRFGKERMLDTPLCETGIAGTAVGMAIAGLRPVCELEFAGFTPPAFDQMVTHAMRYRWRTNGAFQMPIVFRLPAGGGHEGFESHSDSVESWFINTPGSLVVLYPSNAYDAKGLLAAAFDSEDPVAFFEPVARYFVKEEGIPAEHYTVPIGKARIVREGSDVTIVAYGNAVWTAAEAAESLAAGGASAEVIDLRSLRPFDEDAVCESVKKTGRLVVVHEAPVTGGFGAEVVATVAERVGDYLETPPRRVGHGEIVWGVAKLEPYSLLDPRQVVAAARGVLED